MPYKNIERSPPKPITGNPVPYERLPKHVYRVQTPKNHTLYNSDGLQASTEGQLNFLTRQKDFASQEDVKIWIERHCNKYSTTPSPFISLRSCGVHARNWAKSWAEGSPVLILTIDTDILKAHGLELFNGSQPHEILCCGYVPTEAIVEVEDFGMKRVIEPKSLPGRYPGYLLDDGALLRMSTVRRFLWELWICAFRVRFRGKYWERLELGTTGREYDEFRDVGCGLSGRGGQNGFFYTETQAEHRCPYKREVTVSICAFSEPVDPANSFDLSTITQSLQSVRITQTVSE